MTVWARLAAGAAGHACSFVPLPLLLLFVREFFLAVLIIIGIATAFLTRVHAVAADIICVGIILG